MKDNSLKTGTMPLTKTTSLINYLLINTVNHLNK